MLEVLAEPVYEQLPLSANFEHGRPNLLASARMTALVSYISSFGLLSLLDSLPLFAFLHLKNYK